MQRDLSWFLAFIYLTNFVDNWRLFRKFCANKLYIEIQGIEVVDFNFSTFTWILRKKFEAKNTFEWFLEFLEIKKFFSEFANSFSYLSHRSSQFKCWIHHLTALARLCHNFTILIFSDYQVFRVSFVVQTSKTKPRKKNFNKKFRKTEKKSLKE